MVTLDLFRLWVGDIGSPSDFSDEQLQDILDEAVDDNAAAAIVWRMKAAMVSSLVDISESGSSRSNSQLARNYLEMAKTFDDKSVVVEAEVRKPAVITPITRTKADFL